MDVLHLLIAFAPLAVYLLVMGMLNLSSRPFLMTGGRDLAALGVAISGFVVAGPMELFLPLQAASRFGGYVWLLLLGLYALVVMLMVLLSRPRLVIYNITADQLRPILGSTVSELDPDARWAGDNLALPNLGVQLHVEGFPLMRNIQLLASGSEQSYGGWRRLEVALGKALYQEQGTPNPYGLTLMLCGVLIAGLVGFWVVTDQQAVAQALRNMLRQ